MKVFIVYWHPEPKSFNHAMFSTACESFSAQHDEVRTSNLQEMNFDPVSSRKNFKTVSNADFLKLQLEEKHATETGSFSDELELEMQKLEWCDLMIWQFPLWWFGLPAVFKGWVDRVFAMGRTYGGGKIYETGVFRGKRAMLSLTTGGPQDAYLPGGFNGDIDAILRPIHRGMLQFVGFDVLAPQIVYAPAHIDDTARQQELAQFATRLRHIAEESAIEVGQY